MPCFYSIPRPKAADALVAELARISAAPVPERVERQRSRFQDAMLDTHFMLGMSRFALAADADLLVGFSDLLASMGAEKVAAVDRSRLPQKPVREADLRSRE